MQSPLHLLHSTCRDSWAPLMLPEVRLKLHLNLLLLQLLLFALFGLLLFQLLQLLVWQLQLMPRLFPALLVVAPLHEHVQYCKEKSQPSTFVFHCNAFCQHIFSLYVSLVKSDMFSSIDCSSNFCSSMPETMWCKPRWLPSNQTATPCLVVLVPAPLA